jgi:hypothetical protein
LLLTAVLAHQCSPLLLLIGYCWSETLLGAVVGVIDGEPFPCWMSDARYANFGLRLSRCAAFFLRDKAYVLALPCDMLPPSMSLA